MEILNNLTKNITNNFKNIIESQNDFLKNTIGEFTDLAIDFGIKKLFPDYIEDDIIDIKDSLINEGMKSGIDTAIEKTINVGKNLIGIINGDFKNIDQVEEVLKEGGLIDGISDTINFITNKLEKNNIISEESANIIKNGKEIILNIVEQRLKKEFVYERTSIKNIEELIDDWHKKYNEKNLEGLNNTYNNLKEQINNIMPFENINNNIKQISNIHELLKNNSDFNFEKVYLELAKKI